MFGSLREGERGDMMMKKMNHLLPVIAVLASLTGCTQIKEMKRFVKKGETYNVENGDFTSIKPGEAVGNIVMPNFANVESFYREALALPVNNNSQLSITYDGTKDNVGTVAVAATITEDQVFSYEKLAMAACADMVQIGVGNGNGKLTGALDFGRSPNDQAANAWSGYQESLAKNAWGKLTISAAEMQILDQLRQSLVSQGGTDTRRTAIFVCSAILLAPNAIVQ